jgi:hypothetical protein
MPSIIRTQSHTHDNYNVLKYFTEVNSTLLYKGIPIKSTHETLSVTSKDGAHGFRFYEDKLQYLKNNTTWTNISIATNITLSTTKDNALVKYNNGYYVPAFLISKADNNALSKNSDGYYVQAFMLSKYANNSLVRRTDGYYVPAFLVSKQANNALVKYTDGYYVPKIPVNNATLEDVNKSKEDTLEAISNAEKNMMIQYNIISQKIEQIGATITKLDTHHYIGDNKVLSLVIDISELYDNSINAILNSEILIQNKSNTNTLTLQIIENTIETLNDALQKQEVQRYKLTNTSNICINIKGEYELYLYVNYI